MTSLTVTEAAKIAGVSRRTILRAIAIGDLPARKSGAETAGWIIQSRHLNRWLAAR